MPNVTLLPAGDGLPYFVPYFAGCVGFLVPLLLIILAVEWVERRRSVSWRLRHGRCLTCGADLRGAPGGPPGSGAVDRHGYCPRCEPKNLCPACGYDLRATPDRCPECGAMPRPHD